MSMPFTQFSCDRCEFSADSTVLWGRFSYQFEDGQTMNVERRLGWCRQCNTVTAIEDLSGERARVQIIEADQQLASLLNPSGILNRLKKIFGNQERLQMIDYWQQQKAAGDRVLSFLAHRKEPARCLLCSSVGVVELPQMQDVGREIHVVIGFAHPRCGGQLLAIKSRFSVSVEPGNWRYSPSGVLL